MEISELNEKFKQTFNEIEETGTISDESISNALKQAFSDIYQWPYKFADITLLSNYDESGVLDKLSEEELKAFIDRNKDSYQYKEMSDGEIAYAPAGEDIDYEIEKFTKYELGESIQKNEALTDIELEKRYSECIKQFDSLKKRIQTDLSKVSIQKEIDSDNLVNMKSCLHYLSQAIRSFNDDRQDTEVLVQRTERELEDALKAIQKTSQKNEEVIDVAEETAKFAKQGYDALEEVIKNLEAYGERTEKTSQEIDALYTAQEILRNMVPELQ